MTDAVMLARRKRLHHTPAFSRGFQPFSTGPARPLEHAMHARSSDGDDRFIKHHERHFPIVLQRMLVVIVEDCLLFPLRDPTVARRARSVDSTAISTGETTRREFQPAEQPLRWQLGSLRPVRDVVDAGVASGLRNPMVLQSSPSAFCRACSLPSARR
jgi:hypothetical protein